jgi:hypothetical protein
MKRGEEGIPRTRDPNPYFFDIFSQSVKEANKARETLRQIYWRQQNGSKPTVPTAQTEQVETTSNSTDVLAIKAGNNPSDNYGFARTHVKVINEQATELGEDQLTSESKVTPQLNIY